MSRHYFVTGVTGAVGSALLPLLLEQKSNKIWLLMRADSTEHLQQRLHELIVFWDMDYERYQDDLRRITPILGNTDEESFALETELYSEIVGQTTHIIHCAGVVRMNLPLQVAQKHALGATKNIVNLAKACQSSGQLQKIEFISTVGVGGRLPGVLPEFWITQPRTFHNSYEQAKAEAEDYLHEQIEKHNLPVTVHRPSMVVGDSKTGKIIHFQIFYHICEFLAGRRTFGLLPKFGNVRLDTVPVDYVAGIIKWSSERPDCNGQIFHLCSGANTAIKLTELQNVVCKVMQTHGLKLPIIFSLSSALFNLVIKVVSPFLNKKKQRVVKSFPFFLDYIEDDQGFSNEATKRFLSERSALEMPAHDDYLKIVLKNYLNKKTQ